MSEASQTIYHELTEALSEKSINLSRGEYRDLIENLQGHLQCIIDALDEEDKAGE